MPSGMIHISFIDPNSGVEISMDSEMSHSDFKDELDACKLMSQSMTVDCGGGQFAFIPINVLEHSIIMVV